MYAMTICSSIQQSLELSTLLLHTISFVTLHSHFINHHSLIPNLDLHHQTMTPNKSLPYIQLYPNSSTFSHSHYLPHLDGLRAIALTGVLLFHFQVPHFQGGFAGVDVFLSLSGFLITRNILRQLSQNKFTLISFYKRRFFRLYPASVATVLFTLCLGFLSFPPDLFAKAGDSALAAMLFYANIFFNLQASYFDSAVNTKPFLHFWSLSLEEQYYFVCAPLIVLIYRFTKRSVVIARVLVLMLIASLTFAVHLDTSFSAFAFFQLPSRIWQFAAGALTAVLTRRSTATSNMKESKSIGRWQDNRVEHVELLCSSGGSSSAQKRAVQSIPHLAKELLCWCALSTLFGSYFFLPHSAPMYLMLPTTISTCIILALDDTFFATHVLSLSFMQSLGHLSYSAYLVHWPIFVFSLHLCNAFGMDKPNVMLMMLVTLGAAMMLRQWIEDPVRRGDRRWVFALMTVCAFIFVFSVMSTKGFPSRVGNINTNVSLSCHRHLFSRNCIQYQRYDPRFSGLVEKACVVGDGNGTRSRYVFIGDSFTMHLSSALKDAGIRRKEWYIFYWAWGCKFAAMSMAQELNKRCKKRHDSRWKAVHSLPPNQILVVANHWKIWKGKFGNRSRTDYIKGLKKEISDAGHQMILVGEPPGVHAVVNDKYFACADISILPLARLWAKLRGKEFKGAASCFDPDKGLQPRPGRIRERQEDIRMIPKVMPDMGYVDVMSHLCRKDRETTGGWSCRLPGNNTGIVYDTGYCRGATHFSYNGSRALSQFYEQQILDKAMP